MATKYELPKLDYEYTALSPYISEEQLRIHHTKHHSAYVNGANSIFEKLQKARQENSDLDMKALLKELSFHVNGHILHSLFWKSLCPKNLSKERPEGKLSKLIDSEFGSFERFKKEFNQAALTVEGSGWAALSYCQKTKELLIMQIEKHNANCLIGFKPLLVLDLFEHAYYLDYKNERAKFIDMFWNIINWKEAEKRIDENA